MLQQVTGESIEGLGWAVFMGKKEVQPESKQLEDGKFIGLKMGRDSQCVFIGPEISLCLL